MPTKGRREDRSISSPDSEIRLSLSSSVGDALAIVRSLHLPAPCAVQPCMVPPPPKQRKTSHDDHPSALAAESRSRPGAQRAADHARPVHQGPELRESARAAKPDRADPAAA